MRLKTILLLIILAICALAPSPAPAQLTTVNVGYSAISADQLPAWVAKDSGMFEKNGLDAQLIFFTGGSTAILALVSGDVPITQVAGPGLVSRALAGSDPGVGAAGDERRGRAGQGPADKTRPPPLRDRGIP